MAQNRPELRVGVREGARIRSEKLLIINMKLAGEGVYMQAQKLQKTEMVRGENSLKTLEDIGGE